MAGLVRIGFFSEPPKQADLVIPRGKCRVVLNGESMTLDAFRRRATAWKQTQPQVNFRPDPRATYPCVDRVLAIVKEAGAVRLGFVGNEVAPDDGDPKP